MKYIRTKEEYLMHIDYLSYSVGKRDLHISELKSDICNMLPMVQRYEISCVPSNNAMDALCDRKDRPVIIKKGMPVIIKSGMFVIDAIESFKETTIKIWIVNEEENESLQIVSLSFKRTTCHGILPGFWISGKWDDALAETFHNLHVQLETFLEQRKLHEQEEDEKNRVELTKKVEKFERLF